MRECTHMTHVITTGASFHNASAAPAECSSGSVIATLTCGSITCGNPIIDPEGNVPETIVNGEDAEIESWPWQVSLRRVSTRFCFEFAKQKSTTCLTCWYLSLSHDIF